VNPPVQAMVLAAGFGRRMRPLTAETAKPLLPLGRRTLLDHVLDRLEAAGVRQIVVNAHWQADRLAAHLGARRGPAALRLRREARLLDTGGAVAAALAEGDLDDAPLYLVNGDSFWLNGPAPALLRLAGAFDADALDAVLLVHPTFQVASETGAGDFALDEWGAVRRPAEQEIVPYVYAGVQLLHPRALHEAGAPGEPFGMNSVWDRSIAEGRLRALVHDGLWFHLSTPADLAQAEDALQAQVTGETR